MNVYIYIYVYICIIGPKSQWEYSIFSNVAIMCLLYLIVPILSGMHPPSCVTGEGTFYFSGNPYGTPVFDGKTLMFSG